MSGEEEAAGNAAEESAKKKTKKKKEKSDTGDDEKNKDKKSKKKQKEKESEAPSDGDGVDEKKAPAKKKKNKQNVDGEDTRDTERTGELRLSETDLLTSPSPKKNKSRVSVNESKRSSVGDGLLSPSQMKKFTAEYFEAVLDETREKLEKKIKISDGDRDKFLGACENYYNVWYGKWENEQRLLQLEDNNGNKDEIAEARALFEESAAALPKSKKKCIKAALKIFNQLDEEKLEKIEDKIVKGAIIAQAGSEELAKFTEEGKENEKLIKKLFNDPDLMRDMLRFGGPTKNKYGNAMKIYCKCVEMMDGGDLDSKWQKVNKKIALACALELAGGIREFDSAIEIDPVKRYKHFEEAHRKGELDPAFPHFTVWEMRQIVNCDAPNEQMKWIRHTVMNYAPHITLITSHKLRYTYILETDVRIRKPAWTGSPRTYQMVLSGGGNQSINSWFGRFLLKSFGLPAWGATERKFEGFCRWTPEGWEAMNGAKWESCSWQGKSGLDFKLEIEARNKAPQQEYWKKLVMLDALAAMIDGDPNSIPDYEKDVLHPERLWRSLAIISMELLFQTEPDVQRTFERKGRNLVKTRNEMYLESYELDKPDAEVSVKGGIVTIPASRHGFIAGNVGVVDSFGGGKQVNFVADGTVEYELPENVPPKKYSMKLEVCTVSATQAPLTIKIDDLDDKTLKMVIPYTVGDWQFTAPVEVELGPGSLVRLSRPKGSMGFSLKKLVLS